MNHDANTPPGSGPRKMGSAELDQQLLAEVSNSCDPALCRQFLVWGADVNVRDEDGCTPLLWAVLAGSRPTVELLLEHGAPVNDSNHDQETPLHWAATIGHVEIAVLLLKRGANVNARDAFDVTPLRSATLNEDEEMIELLKRYGAAE